MKKVGVESKLIFLGVVQFIPDDSDSKYNGQNISNKRVVRCPLPPNYTPFLNFTVGVQLEKSGGAKHSSLQVICSLITINKSLYIVCFFFFFLCRKGRIFFWILVEASDGWAINIWWENAENSLHQNIRWLGLWFMSKDNGHMNLSCPLKHWPTHSTTSRYECLPLSLRVTSS